MVESYLHGHPTIAVHSLLYLCWRGVVKKREDRQGDVCCANLIDAAVQQDNLGIVIEYIRTFCLFLSCWPLRIEIA